MQDIHPLPLPVPVPIPIPISVPGERAISDRRLRPQSQTAAALNCPRCDSLNTKFCYYNNYNLSQPRYFCKNCRRYWTKGGVLRNVPVGGGCRKAKRSSKPKQPSKPKPPNSHSSSESSDTRTRVVRVPELGALIGENTTATTTTTPKVCPALAGYEDSQVMFTSEVGGFGNVMMNNNSGDPLGLINSMLDPTVRIDDMMQSRGSNGGVVELDNWEGCTTGAGLFDFLVPSDHQSEYWGQTTSYHPDQWSYNNNANSDLPLFLP